MEFIIYTSFSLAAIFILFCLKSIFQKKYKNISLEDIEKYLAYALLIISIVFAIYIQTHGE